MIQRISLKNNKTNDSHSLESLSSSLILSPSLPLSLSTLPLSFSLSLFLSLPLSLFKHSQ